MKSAVVISNINKFTQAILEEKNDFVWDEERKPGEENEDTHVHDEIETTFVIKTLLFSWCRYHYMNLFIFYIKIQMMAGM